MAYATLGNQEGISADSSTVRCTQVREAVSARIDDEDPGTVDEAQLRAHLAACTGCTVFAERARALTPTVHRAAAGPYAELENLAARFPLRADRRTTGLRLAIAVLAVVELLTPLIGLVQDHGYGGEDHAGHETLSFTVAVAAGLLVVAIRPIHARGYLPLVLVAMTLLLATAAGDVAAGRAALVEELPHLNLAAAAVLLWLLARGGGHRRPRPVEARPRRQPARRLRVVLRAAAVVATGAPVLVAVPASAHATLQGTSPGAGAVVAHVPAAVVLRFDEAVGTTPTSLRVFGPGGQRVDSGSTTHPGGAASRVGIGLTDGGVGTYLVAWRVVSADTHPISGSFTFSVGHPTRAPAVTAPSADAVVGAILGITRWLGYAGVALLIGVVAFLERCWPAGWAARSLRRLPWIGLGGVLLGAVLGFLVKGPYDAGLCLGSTGRPALLDEVTHSAYGHATFGRLACLAVIAALLAGRHRLPAALHRAGLALSFVALALTFALSGHAATEHPQWLGLLSDTVHVVAVSLWIGGLTALVLALTVSRRGAVTPPVTTAEVSRFSSLALWAVVVLVLTGTYQSWRHVGAWAALAQTTYGRELLVKIGLVALVIVVAAVSRRVAGRHGGVLTTLRRTVGVELVGAVAILAVTAALVATEPADEAYHPSVAATLRFGADTVQVSAVPAGERRMRIHLYVFGADGRPTEPKQITASAALPGQDIGALPLALIPAAPGHRISTLTVPLTGDWQLTVTLRTSPIDESSQEVDVPIR